MPDKIIDFIKTVLIYILTVTMLVFAGIYINDRQNAGQKSEIPWEKQIIFAGGGGVYTDIDENHVSPVQVTVTFGGNSRSIVYNDTYLISRVYDDFRFAISGLFNKSAGCEIYDKIDGDALWRKCAESENSLYIKYAGDYIYPVIYTFLNPKNYDSADTSKGIAKVRELFIIDADPIFGVSRDSEGNIAAFIPSEENRGILYTGGEINASLQAAYNNSEGGIPCRFLKNNIISGETGANKNNIKNLVFPESFHLYDNHVIHSSVLAFENPLSDETGNIDMQKDYIKELFRLFNFNYENAYFASGIYRDGANNSVRFGNGGKIVYTHRPNNNINAGGLHLARFLGYDADYYTFYEKLKAASAFAYALSKELAGGHESNLYLKEIIAESSHLKIIFAYYHKGTEIKIKGADGAVILKINNDGISEAEINAVRVSYQGLRKNDNPLIILREADRLISREIEEGGAFPVNQLELIYNIDYSANSGECAPDWVIK